MQKRHLDCVTIVKNVVETRMPYIYIYIYICQVEESIESAPSYSFTSVQTSGSLLVCDCLLLRWMLFQASMAAALGNCVSVFLFHKLSLMLL